jgi:high affinity sulfate transporter 1
MPRAVSDGGENLDADGSDLGLGGSRASSHRRTDGTCVHRARFPPEKGLLDDFSTAVKDMLFAGDDPLRQYKEQPSWSGRAWLGLRHVFPVLDWGRRYTLDDFRGNLVAGLTIASLCIPQVNSCIHSKMNICMVV